MKLAVKRIVLYVLILSLSDGRGRQCDDEDDDGTAPVRVALSVFWRCVSTELC